MLRWCLEPPSTPDIDCLLKSLVYLAFNIQLTADTGRPQLQSVSERIHVVRQVLATEVSLLPVLVVCGMPCCHVYDRT